MSASEVLISFTRTHVSLPNPIGSRIALQLVFSWKLRTIIETLIFHSIHLIILPVYTIILLVYAGDVNVLGAR